MIHEKLIPDVPPKEIFDHQKELGRIILRVFVDYCKEKKIDYPTYLGTILFQSLTGVHIEKLIEDARQQGIKLPKLF